MKKIIISSLLIVISILLSSSGWTASPDPSSSPIPESSDNPKKDEKDVIDPSLPPDEAELKDTQKNLEKIGKKALIKATGEEKANKIIETAKDGTKKVHGLKNKASKDLKKAAKKALIKTAGKEKAKRIIKSAKNSTKKVRKAVKKSAKKIRKVFNKGAKKTHKLKNKAIKNIKKATKRGLIKIAGKERAKKIIKIAKERGILGGEVFNGIMTASNIGNTCKVIEEYMDGKRPVKDVVKTLVDIPLGGTIASVETIGTKYRHFTKYRVEAKKEINNANKKNMEAFLLQWEIRLRKTGLSKKEARKYVGNAVELGDLSILERKASALRTQGKNITSPKLIVNPYEEADDTFWERVATMGIGIAKKPLDGTLYIITAPYRVVSALAERELAEAELEYSSVFKTAQIKTRLYRKLRQRGIGKHRALRAINDWEKGDFERLKKLIHLKGKSKFISVRRKQSDWYCTNKPEISSPAPMTEMINQEIERRNTIRAFFGLPQEEKLK